MLGIIVEISSYHTWYKIVKTFSITYQYNLFFLKILALRMRQSMNLALCLRQGMNLALPIRQIYDALWSLKGSAMCIV